MPQEELFSVCVCECLVPGQLFPVLCRKGNDLNRGIQYLGYSPRGCQFDQIDLI